MPTIELELAAAGTAGATFVAGVDEAGRGAIAGPVVAAAVILPLDRPDLADALAGVNDSKQLAAAERERLHDVILATALSFGVGCVPAEGIDELGIIGANMRAMREAIARLNPPPDYLLIDGPIRLKRVPFPQEPIVRGDSASLSIAAASILAKVNRDRMMRDYERLYPGYGFGRHKGYCTAAHVAALAELGPCALHRRSFAPLRPVLFA
jgi:ribonuclease HII